MTRGQLATEVSTAFLPCSLRAMELGGGGGGVDEKGAQEKRENLSWGLGGMKFVQGCRIALFLQTGVLGWPVSQARLVKG